MLQLYFSVLVVSVLVADCKHLPADQIPLARNSTPCSMEAATICSTIQASEKYSMLLDAERLQSSGEITGEHQCCDLQASPKNNKFNNNY